MHLLERGDCLEALDAALDRSTSGSGWVVLVAGEAGIGKTSLLRHFAEAREKRARMLWGGCEALFTPHPLAPLYDVARQVGGDFIAALGAAVSRHEVFNAALDRLARLPGATVLIIEDVHWADEATLDFIKFLGRRLLRLNLMLVISYRDDQVYDKHPLCSVLGDLPPRAMSRVKLSPLSEAAVGTLAEAAGHTSTSLHQVTGGNPFFVTEVLATPGDGVPATVRDAVIARLARLSDVARRVAQIVSLVPGKTERWLVDQTVAPGAPALVECFNAGMVALPDYSLAFRHELARRAVEDSMSPTERQDLNALILAELLRHGEEKIAIARLVHHAERAGDSAAVLRFAPLAAERATQVGAHREAADYLRAALKHGGTLAGTERAQLLDRLSFECYLTDQVEDAVSTREESLALWRAADSRLKEGDTLRWMSRVSWYNGQKTQAEHYAVQAIEVLQELPPGRELAMAYSNRSQLCMLEDDAAPALEWGYKALDLANALGETEIQTHALNNIGTTKLGMQNLEGRDDLQQALKIALEGGYEEHVARAYVNLSTTMARHRDFTFTKDFLEAGIAYCDERDLDSWSRYMRAQRADAMLALGLWDGAALDADTLIRSRSSAPVIKIPALVTLGRLRARRGDPDIQTPLLEAYQLAVPTRELQRLGPALAARAEAAWLDESVSEELLTALTDAYVAGRRQSDPWLRSELAFWLWRHGRLIQVPPDVCPPFSLQMGGDWQAAAEQWRTIGCPYEQAMALADSDEEAPLRSALEIFERLGATPMAGRVRRKLRASGVRGLKRGAQERTRQNPGGMTNQELKVLSLLAEGCRNADIARRLFVSEKTVGHHVSAVLSKLGVRSRGEAVAAASRLGVPLSRQAAGNNK